MPGIRCAVVGLGPIGSDIARLASGHSHFEMCAAIDIAEDLIGKALHELIDVEGTEDIVITRDLSQTLARDGLNVVFHATGSRLEIVGDELESILESGTNVVSTCEELVYPWPRHEKIARRLHQAGMRGGSSLLAAGVNPGFAMDLLPLVLASATSRVDRVEVARYTDIGTRRLPLQTKLGVGITESEFWGRERRGQIGHVGLLESMYLIANALGWRLTSSEATIKPVLMESVDTSNPTLSRIRGVSHFASGLSTDGREVSLRLEMFAGADSSDSVRIHGQPDIHVVVKGGFRGDQCTTAVVLNLAPAIVDAPAGLLTVADIRRMRDLPCGTAKRHVS